jgi:hypothetical protein
MAETLTKINTPGKSHLSEEERSPSIASITSKGKVNFLTKLKVS